MILNNQKIIVIFEGIATSGKTTLQKLLLEKLTLENKIKIISENMTLMPLIENKSQKVALNHLRKILLKLGSNKNNIFITDRFHFTHIFRTKSNIKYFKKFEKDLQNGFKVLIVLLYINEGSIKKNIENSLDIRKTWAKGKKGTIAEKVIYYKDQQRKLLRIAKESTLPVLKIDTTKKNWNKYILKIIKKI